MHEKRTLDSGMPAPQSGHTHEAHAARRARANEIREAQVRVFGRDYALPLSVASGGSFRVLPVDVLRPLVMLTDVPCDVVTPAVSLCTVLPIETENPSEVPRTTVTCLSLSLGSSIIALLSADLRRI